MYLEERGGQRVWKPRLSVSLGSPGSAEIFGDWMDLSPPLGGLPLDFGEDLLGGFFLKIDGI